MNLHQRTAFTAAFSLVLCAQHSTLTAEDYQIPGLPTPLSSSLPYDVDIPALRALSVDPQKQNPPFTIPEENIPLAQRWFDIFSWQTFLALNWPADASGNPDTSKTLSDNSSPRVWEGFVEIGQVFREDGKAPDEWSQAVKNSWKDRTLWINGMGLTDSKSTGDGTINAPLLDESLQAFTGPMIDQNGKWVRYQVAINNVEFDYLVKNELYNQDGQAKFTETQKIQFPANNGTESYGAMEIKMSWLQLSEESPRERFFIRNAKVIPHTGEPFKADFGLVGMHIAVRTQSAPTWIWATFEQVDNTTTNNLERDSKGRSLRPNFFNPDNPTIPVNTLAPKNAAPVVQYNPATGKLDGPAVFTSWDEEKTTTPTQTLMVFPIDKATAALNKQVQQLLAQQNSVFQYYELIGTQWPSAPNFPAFSNGVANQSNGLMLPSSPESILYKIPGKVVPVHLINTTMETFFQEGNQVAGPLADDYRLPAGLLADPNIVFATESCAGCHFSAGAVIGFKKDSRGRYIVQQMNNKNYRIPIYGQNSVEGMTGDADYSWLLQLRAKSKPYEGKDVVTLEEAGVLIPNNQILCPAEK
ncbi:hypothetical protein [Persicirhabdus sediminis]|uniref:Uncharacterized protein n=1 Tax=Persicirhabdus sediminis TaxID=454144 RepID=A0A8J7MBQ0_9BACT|nr:hypothetical protein [Persicirhabdus sediminis]MBK1790167.1 hypothetical protein [Persicirhabdus sediminis]